MPDARPYEPGAYTARGYDTPTGKFELYSTSIERYAPGLSPLPTYTPPWDRAEPEEYPMVLSVGARLPFALHSRMHEVPWTRSLRPDPMADLNDGDAAAWAWARGTGSPSRVPPGLLRYGPTPPRGSCQGAFRCITATGKRMPTSW